MLSLPLLEALSSWRGLLAVIGAGLVLIVAGWALSRWYQGRQEPEKIDLSEETIADGLGAAVLIVQLPEQRIRYWNDDATRLFGVSAREARGRTTRFFHVSDDNYQHLRESCGRSLAENGVFRTEYPLRTSDGRTVPTEQTLTLLKNDERRLALYVIRDVSRRKTAEAEAQEYEQQLESVMASVSEVVLVVGEDEEIAYASPSLKRTLGFWPQEVRGKPVAELAHAEDREAVHRLIHRARGDHKNPTSEEFRCPDNDGRLRRLEALARRPARGAHISGVVVSMRDVTERREAEEALRRSEEKYSKIFRISPLAISISRRDDGTVLEANEGFFELFGYEPAEVEGRSLNELGAWVSAGDWERVLEQVRATGTARRVEVQIQTKSGQERDVLIFAERLSLAGTPCLLTIGHDITSKKRAERELQKLALYDSLTELPNRNLFEDRLEQALRRAERNDTGVGVLFLDLDRFKVVNDTLGHHAGDELLAKIADRIRSCFRAEDTVARFGGDEFAALLEDLEQGEEARQAAKRLVEALDEPVELSDSSVHVSASIGIALRSSTLTSADDLLRFSDVAMYRAKQKTEGTSFEVFDPARDGKATQRLHLENDLRGAADRDELSLAYQPIVDLSDGRMSGVEALVRWDHPERNRLAPSEFIPVAEEAGLIVPIGEWVLREACRSLRHWRDTTSTADDFYMSVNLSVRQLTDADITDIVRDCLEESTLPAERLQLEITESTAMQRSDRLTELKELGLQLAIDDFGTGYSSLEYLKHLAVDTIKIDQTFVGNLQEATHNAAIVQSVLLLADQLGLNSVAEGVVQESQHQYLKYRGCRQGQGFYYLEPVPAETITDLLENGRRPLPQPAASGSPS